MCLDTKLAVEFLFTFFQSADDCAIAIANIIRHHETEYLAALEVSKLLLIIFNLLLLPLFLVFLILLPTQY